MGKGDKRGQNKLSVIRRTISRDLMNSMVTIAHNTLLYIVLEIHQVLTAKKTGDYVKWWMVVIFCNINVYQTLTLYTLNLHNVMCQSYPSKASGREDSSQNCFSCHSILYQVVSSSCKTLHLFWATPWCGRPEVGGREEWFSDISCVSTFACLSIKHYSIWRYTEGRLGV